MREIKFLGIIKKPSVSRSYQYALFECPECKQVVERVRKDGIKANYCGHKCYAKNRDKRGPYKAFVVISGYRYIQSPGHPYATLKGYVAEHRLIAEKIIGRYLRPDEVVHHKNKNKLDNSDSNLMVMTVSNHIKLHKKTCRRDSNGCFSI